MNLSCFGKMISVRVSETFEEEREGERGSVHYSRSVGRSVCRYGTIRLAWLKVRPARPSLLSSIGDRSPTNGTLANGGRRRRAGWPLGIARKSCLLLPAEKLKLGLSQCQRENESTNICRKGCVLAASGLILRGAGSRNPFYRYYQNSLELLAAAAALCRDSGHQNSKSSRSSLLSFVLSRTLLNHMDG